MQNNLRDCQYRLCKCSYIAELTLYRMPTKDVSFDTSGRDFYRASHSTVYLLHAYIHVYIHA